MIILVFWGYDTLFTNSGWKLTWGYFKEYIFKILTSFEGLMTSNLFVFVCSFGTWRRWKGREEVLKYVWRSSRGDGRPDKQFWPLMTTPWVNMLRNLGPPFLVCLFAYLGNIGQPNHGLIIDIQFRVFFNNLPSQNRIILPLFWTVIFVFSIHR